MEINDNYIPYWMKGNDNSIALYSSTRCVRNFRDKIFPLNKKIYDPKLTEKITDEILADHLQDGTIYRIDLQKLSITELSLLQKIRILPNIRISELKKLTLYAYKTGRSFLLLNYQDHLTFYSYAQGMDIRKADRSLQKFLKLFDDNYFAKDEKGRYLTSSIEYFGSGFKCFTVLTLLSLRMKNKLSDIISSLSQNGYSYKKFFGFGSNLEDMVVISNKDSLTLNRKDIVGNFEDFFKLLEKEIFAITLRNSELNDILKRSKRLLHTEFLTFKGFMEAYFLLSVLAISGKIKKMKISELNKVLSILIINLPKVIHTARVKKKLIEKLANKLY